MCLINLVTPKCWQLDSKIVKPQNIRERLEIEMNYIDARRDFLVKGAAAAGAFMTGQTLGHSQEVHKGHGTREAKPLSQSEHSMHQPPSANDSVDEYPRTKPGVGGPIGSPTDRGKLVPGFRDANLPPIPTHAPDLKQLE